MAKRKDTQADISAASADAKLDAVSAKDAPLPVDAPKLAASADLPKIDVASLIGPVRPAAAAKAPAADTQRSRWPAYAPLAASIALAAVIGALTGATATSMLLNDTTAA